MPPLSLQLLPRVDVDASADTFGTSETVLGNVYVSPSGVAPGVTLPVKLIAELSSVTGTATIRLRQGSIAGTILATATATTAGVVVTATGTLTAPAVATQLVVTGQNSTGTSDMHIFSVHVTGDGTDPEFDDLTGTEWTELSPWAGGLMFRDDNDRAWLLDRDEETAYSRDELRRVFPQLHGAGHIKAKQCKPWAVLVGTDIWLFSLHTRTPSLVPGVFDADAYELTILDGLDLTVKFTSIQKTANPILNYAVVYDGSEFVWFLYVSGGTTVTAHRHSVGAVGTTSTTTYETTGGAAWQCIDAARLSSGQIAVVYTSVSGHTITVRHSYLDVATGQADTAPAAAGATVTAITPSAICGGGISILENQTDSATQWRYMNWQSDPGDATKVDLVMRTINATTLAITSTAVIETRTPTGTNDSSVLGQVCGYFDDTDSKVYYWAHLKDDTTVSTTGYAFNQRITNNDTTGLLTATTVLGAWLASKPFKREDGDWYVLTGYDDGEDVALQRSLHVRRNGTTNVIAQIGYTEMGPAYFAPDMDTVNSIPQVAINYRNLPFVTPVVQVPGGRLIAGVTVSGETRASTQVRVMSLDFNATYSRGAVIPGDALVYPGGVPQVAGPKDDLHDLSPLHGPNLPTTAALGAGAALGTFTTTYLYRFTDASGRVYRSSPAPFGTHAFLDGGARSLTVRNLLHIGRGTAFIEIYASTATDPTPRIQHIIPNDPTDLTETVAVNPATWSGTTEAVYTSGGGLINFPPPACRCVEAWRDRVFLSGTGIDGEVWYSHEAAEGVGVRLNPVLRANWGNADGPIYGMGAVDWNYLSLLRRNGAAVLSGAGADGSGSGNYVVQALNTRCGTTRPFSVVSGPAGAYFQNAADDLVYVVTPGLQVLDVSSGSATHLDGATITAAAYMVTHSQLWFFLADGAILVLDYKFAAKDQPAGQWYRWASDGLDSHCVGAVEESDGSITWLQANKALRRIQAPFTDTDASENEDPILMKLTTGKMPLAGVQGETCVERIKILGQHVGASDLRVTVTPDSGTPEDEEITTSSPVDYVMHPGTCLRVQEVEVSVEETASTTEGFVLDSISIDHNPRGHQKRLASSKFA